MKVKVGVTGVAVGVTDGVTGSGVEIFVGTEVNVGVADAGRTTSKLLLFVVTPKGLLTSTVTVSTPGVSGAV